MHLTFMPLECETECAVQGSGDARAAADQALRQYSKSDAESAEAVGPRAAGSRRTRSAALSPAEVKALSDLLHPEGEGLFPPLVDAVNVQSGYEARAGGRAG